MPKTLTKKQAATLARLQSKRDSVEAEIYSAAYPNRDVPFSKCFDMADDATRADYIKSLDSLGAYRVEMVAEGRAYFRDQNNYIGFTPN